MDKPTIEFLEEMARAQCGICKTSPAPELVWAGEGPKVYRHLRWDGPHLKCHSESLWIKIAEARAAIAKAEGK